MVVRRYQSDFPFQRSRSHIFESRSQLRPNPVFPVSPAPSGEAFFEVDFLVYSDEFDIFLHGFDEATPLFSSADVLISWLTEDMADEPISTIPGS